MALIDFGMKARRERDEARRELSATRTVLGVVRRREERKTSALNEIANSTAKAGSAVRLANIARKALGRPVGGGEQ